MKFVRVEVFFRRNYSHLCPVTGALLLRREKLVVGWIVDRRSGDVLRSDDSFALILRLRRVNVRRRRAQVVVRCQRLLGRNIVDSLVRVANLAVL